MINVLLILSNFAGSTVTFIIGCKLFKIYFQHSAPKKYAKEENNSTINLNLPRKKYFDRINEIKQFNLRTQQKN